MTVLKVTMGDTRKILEAYFESSSPQFFFRNFRHIFIFIVSKFSEHQKQSSGGSL